jgi:hypothetical protein
MAGSDMTAVYEAIWAFGEDILGLRKKLGKEFEAHTSQPLGKPLHKYEGRLSLEDKAISLVGKNKDSHKEFGLFVPLEEISDIHLGWDDGLRRWKDTRALIKPLKITFENQGKKALYIYARRVGARTYGNQNKALYERLNASMK